MARCSLLPTLTLAAAFTEISGQTLTLQAGPRYWIDSPKDGPQGGRFAVTWVFPS
ncbi:hypothetical protein GGI52_005296 [Pseudomonas moraviensis]|uniref:Uncharacterized protein n=1 Tax=Pseudomonas moraviensis TaxID=321662 RepID=A0A7Y9W232_9PSED|nr:hypothetical protein [Pseudomonas moraviensis]